MEFFLNQKRTNSILQILEVITSFNISYEYIKLTINGHQFFKIQKDKSDKFKYIFLEKKREVYRKIEANYAPNHLHIGYQVLEVSNQLLL